MRRFFALLFAGCLVLGAGAAAAAAADDPPGARPVVKTPPAKESPKQDAKTPATPIDALRDYTVAMIEGMDEDQLRYLYGIRTRHGVGRAVDVVRRDVGKAVGKCGKEHPALKAQMDAAFAQWEAAVDPLLAESKIALKKTIESQDFVAPARIEKMLDLVNAAGDYTDRQVVKEIVTTEEACTKLLNSMSETRDHLARLLRETLSSLPAPAQSPKGEPAPVKEAAPEKAP